ncbi:MAG TPA: hypothetical protein VNX86_15245 [Rhizomicrobium sp.]|jgi:hypothetical protein|nr:hypothetical protein [Rhizomicrobium sp.]
MADKQEANRSRLVRFSTLAGGAMLLFSAIIQNFWYDRLTSRANELAEAMRDRQLIDKSGLIYQADFFILSSPLERNANRDQLAKQTLQLFAKKLFQSELVAVSAASGFDQQQKSSYLSSLKLRAANVHGDQSASDYMQFIDANGAQFSFMLNKEWRDLVPERARARWTFLVLYVAGALMVLIEPFQDWRNNGAKPNSVARYKFNTRTTA